MSWLGVFFVLMAIMFIMLFLGEWVAFVLLLTGSAGLILIGKANALTAIGSFAWGTGISFELAAIPLFILMGEIMVHGGLSKGFYRSASMWLNRLPGGLAQANILSCAVFAAISGSSPATAAAIGSVSYPELREKKYNRKLIAGSLVGGGALGILIPPSINMMIYGSITETSVSSLFMAGVIPGILCTVLFMGYIAVQCMIKPEYAPKDAVKYTLKEKLVNSTGLFSFLFLIIIVLGSIYTGWATTTEAAALGASLAFVLSILNRSLTLAAVKESLITTVKTSSMILIIVFSAKVLSLCIALSGIGKNMTAGIVALNPSITVFFLCIIVMYLVLGCIMDGTSMMYLTMPLLLPILKSMGIDLIWFGMIMILLTEIGMITPPVGINLYVVRSLMENDKKALKDVIVGSVPFMVMYLAMTVILIAFPALCLWLPGQMG